MYPSQPSQQAGPSWEHPPAPVAGSDIGRLNSALPKPPTYLPPPVPPAGSIYETNRPNRLWFHIPSDKPVLVYIILAILVVIYIPMFLSPQINEAFLLAGAKINSAIIRGEWWRLLTATFLHGPLIHIALTCFSLYMVGIETEALFGRVRFLVIYLVSAIAGSVASFAFSPSTGVGASGALFGIVGALGVYYAINHSLFGRIGKLQFWNIVIVVALNLGIGFSGIFPIDNSAHVGGLITGTVIGFVLCPRYSLGEWTNPLVRRVLNTNKSTLAWITAALVALAVILLFLVVLLLYRQGYISPVIVRR